MAHESAVSRTDFLQQLGVGTAAVAAGVVVPGLGGLAAAAPAGASDAGPKFRLGIVTYNVTAQWDAPTILRVCKNVGRAAVGLGVGGGDAAVLQGAVDGTRPRVARCSRP